MEVNQKRTTAIVVLVVVNLSSLLVFSESSRPCTAWLVQSIPTDMPHLRRVSGVLSTCKISFGFFFLLLLLFFPVFCFFCAAGLWWWWVLLTADVFQWLAGNSTRKLEIVGEYWQLIAHPKDPRSGDYGYSKRDMQKFGAQEGSKVYEAIDNAAERNVSIRYSLTLQFRNYASNSSFFIWDF